MASRTGLRTALEVKKLYESGGLSVTTDFREVLAEVPRNLLGFELRAEFLQKQRGKKVEELF